MAYEGSFIFPGSFHPPELPAPSSTSRRRPGSTACVFLDWTAYIAERKNGTFAEATTRTGETLGVSFWLADPPAVSHFCIHCSGIKVTDLLDEPVVVCAGKDIAVIRVAYSYGARNLESINDLGTADLDYFVYRAHNGKPTLRLLPNPKPLFFDATEVGLLPSEDGVEFLMAVIQPRRVQLQYDVHIFSSKTNMWTAKLALLEPPSPIFKTEDLVHHTDKVIHLEGGILGWVDLWRGIMTCDVLASDPVLHYIQFPDPMPGNRCQCLEIPGWTVRDVTCSNGVVKLIEIEEKLIETEERNRLVMPAAQFNDAMMSYTMPVTGLETGNSMGICTSESILDGWTALTWNRKTTDHWSKEWEPSCRAYVSESSILSLLRHNHPEHSAMKSLVLLGPVWNMHGEDVCYLMAKAAWDDKYAWAMTIDMRKNTMEEGLTIFSAERGLLFKLAYHPFGISKYLNMTSDDWKAGVQIQERGDSFYDPNKTMVLVEGLDSFNTKDLLKDILAMFGDVSCLEFHENKRYGIFQFAHRSSAKEAMKTLDGTQIGRRSFCLSWKPSILSKLAPQKRPSGCFSAKYHPYACLHGSYSSNSIAGSNSGHTAAEAAGLHCSTRGSTPLLH